MNVCKNILKTMQNDSLNSLIFAHPKTNLIWNKFEILINKIKSTADPLMIPETKIDDSFPTENF